MMGVYIKGMEMPKKQVLAVINPDGLVEILNSENILIEEFKAVPVQPHGDLIDRDAARGSIKPWSPEDERNGCTFDTVKKLMYTMLDRAPTVIEAEEGE